MAQPDRTGAGVPHVGDPAARIDVDLRNILDLPGAQDFVRFAPDFGTRFVVTVDTEEEFDWSGPFARTGHGLHHIPQIAAFQNFCESFGVCPTYLVDYPVASDPRAAEILKDAVRSGRAEVGIQLHPWVNPPFDEDVNVHNSYAGNLPPDLERAKFTALRDAIAANFGSEPTVYRAGRYGVGAETARLLCAAAMKIDTSVRARFDYSTGGGPNFRDHPVSPYWIDRTCGLMELPLTTVFGGSLRTLGESFYPSLWRVPRLRGLLARMGILERIPLTPEGVSLNEAVAAIDIALGDGLPVLVFSFHSPSLSPGFTPYMRNAEDVERFYQWWRGVFAHLAKRNVAPASMSQVIAAAQR